MKTIEKRGLSIIQRMMPDYKFFGRKEDESLKMGAIENAVKDNVITVDEMVEEFKKHLENSCR